MNRTPVDQHIASQPHLNELLQHTVYVYCMIVFVKETEVRFYLFRFRGCRFLENTKERKLLRADVHMLWTAKVDPRAGTMWKLNHDPVANDQKVLLSGQCVTHIIVVVPDLFQVCSSDVGGRWVAGFLSSIFFIVIFLFYHFIFLSFPFHLLAVAFIPPLHLLLLLLLIFIPLFLVSFNLPAILFLYPCSLSLCSYFLQISPSFFLSSFLSVFFVVLLFPYPFLLLLLSLFLLLPVIAPLLRVVFVSFFIPVYQCHSSGTHKLAYSTSVSPLHSRKKLSWLLFVRPPPLTDLWKNLGFLLPRKLSFHFCVWFFYDRIFFELGGLLKGHWNFK